MTEKNTVLRKAVFPFIIFAFTIIKGLIFYSDLHLGAFYVPMSFITAGILAVIWIVISPFSDRAARVVLFVLYALVSVLMLFDAVYNAYVAKLPSVVQIGMAGQLTDVWSTILNLVRWKHILLTIDLPLWASYAAVRGTFAAKAERRFPDFTAKIKSASIKKKYVAIASLCVLLVCVLTVMLYPGYRAEYIENELIVYHTMDIAHALHGEEERIVDKSEYVSPDDSSSEYFGLAEGYNLVVIQVEALQNFVIGAVYNGQEITPNLNSLINYDSFYFDRWYYQIGGGNTADAEFAVNNSLFAPEAEAAYVKYTSNTYHGLPYLLKDAGYSGAHVYHNYVGSFWNRESAYPYQGFDDFTSLEDLEETDMFAMGLSDKEMYRQSMETIITYEEPFYCFYITVSSHHPYALPLKDREIVLLPEDEETLFGFYMQAANYADRAIGELIAQFKEAGLYDHTMFVIYGDHYALSNSDANNYTKVSELLGHDYTIFDMFNVPMIMHVPGCGYTEKVSTSSGHIDALPTMLCLLGLKNDKTVMFGHNVLTLPDGGGFVCEQTHVSIGSFISDSVFYHKPHNNIRTNYSVYEFGTMIKQNPDDYESLSEEAEKRIKDCAALLSKDDILLD